VVESHLFKVNQRRKKHEATTPISRYPAIPVHFIIPDAFSSISLHHFDTIRSIITKRIHNAKTCKKMPKLVLRLRLVKKTKLF
jgi:predicted Co/Zn/Cd cation transporter (cation efflux family)